IAPAKMNAAGISPVTPDQKLEEGALARPVGTYDATGLASIDGPRHLVDGLHATEMLGKIIDRKQHCSTLRRCGLPAPISAQRGRDQPAERLHAFGHDEDDK